LGPTEKLPASLLSGMEEGSQRESLCRPHRHQARIDAPVASMSADSHHVFEKLRILQAAHELQEVAEVHSLRVLKA